MTTEWIPGREGPELPGAARSETTDGTCPHCGGDAADLHAYVIEGERLREVCPQCGGGVVVTVDVTYRIEKGDGSE